VNIVKRTEPEGGNDKGSSTGVPDVSATQRKWTYGNSAVDGGKVVTRINHKKDREKGLRFFIKVRITENIGGRKAVKRRKTEFCNA
jgi:hypothetical protein